MAAVVHQDVSYSVELSGRSYTLRGTLYGPERPKATVVLVHGNTYNRAYWDFAPEPSRYAGARRLADAGFLTVNIDRLGSGASDRPEPATVGADAGSNALHQVVQQLRRESAIHTSSGKLFTVGHSSGSTLCLREAAEHQDVDGLVLTGFLHAAGPAAGQFVPRLHAAAQDPRFQDDATVPSDYVTTRPGTRIDFYYAFNADEKVVEADEANKDAAPGGDRSLPEERDSAAFARQIQVPVLAIVGARDLGFCTPPRCPEAARESAFYPGTRDFSIELRPRTGHSLNLHLSAAETTELMCAGSSSAPPASNTTRSRLAQAVKSWLVKPSRAIGMDEIGVRSPHTS